MGSGTGLTGSHGTTGSGLTGTHGTQNTASHLPGTHNTATGHKGALIDDDHSSRTGAGVGSGLSSSSSSGSSTNHNPSLMDKLNPKVDANGDGKAGFMK